MTRFIIGKACCDISAKLREEMARLLEKNAGEQKIIYIVPDQYEYETEKAVYRALDERGLSARSSEVRVRTFSSLSEEILRVLDESKRPADDIVKNIIMHRVIKENKNLLRAFACTAEKQGFCHKMVQTVTMLKTAGINPADLSEESIAEQLSKAPSSGKRDIRSYSIVTDKLRDVGLLYTAYNARLSESWLDKLDFTARAAELIADPETRVFDGAYVFVDCFNDFTGSQMNFLRNVVTFADDVTLGFSAEPEEECAEGRREMFYTINKQISLLREQAELNARTDSGEGAQICREGLHERLAEGTAMRFLSDNIFSGAGAREFADAPELVTANDIYDELDYVAARIRALTAEKGLRYREIAVLCPNPSDYISCIRSAFAKYDIPFFCDIPEPILYLPLVNLVMAILNAAKDFGKENILSLVKTGFLERGGKGRRKPLSKKDADVFESYIYEWAIGDEALKKPFTFNAPETPRAEAVRKAAVEPILELRDKLRGKNGDEMTDCLVRFILDNINMQRAVTSRCIRPDGTTDASLVQFFQRLWDTLMGIFDSLYKGLRGDKITLAEYTQLFRDICASTALAKPPQYMDTVLVGDIDRTRAGGIKAAFIIGAVYDALPSPAAAEGIFSPFETELISESITHIDTTHKKEYSLKSAKDRYCLSLYRVYRAVSLPSEMLCVTCPETDLSGRTVGRSEVFLEIASLFKGVQVKKASEFGEDLYCRSLKAVKQRLAAGLYSEDKAHSSLREALARAGEADFAERLCAMRENRRSGQAHRLSARTSELLFPRNISATKVEQLNLCRFLFFCENGLRVRQKTQRSFNKNERGNAVHYVLQKVLEKYRDKMDDFIALDKKQLSELTDFYLAEYRSLEMSGDFSGDKRAEYLYNNIALAATDVLTVIQAEFAARYYRPKFFELNLADPDGAKPDTQSGSEKGIDIRPLTLDLEDKRRVNITGIVDRVDMFEDKNGQRYLRVVDYKTNNRQFSAHNAQYGVNVQMLLYLFALCDANAAVESGVLPGGVSYTPAKISGAVNDRMSAFSLLSRNHRQSGMYVLDSSTEEEMERYARYITDKIAGEAEGTDPSTDSTAPDISEFLPEPENLISAEAFGEFRERCLDTIRAKISLLFDGNVEALPLSYTERGRRIDGSGTKKDKCPCDYCRFGDICGSAGKKEIVPDIKKKKKGDEGEQLTLDDAAKEVQNGTEADNTAAKSH